MALDNEQHTRAAALAAAHLPAYLGSWLAAILTEKGDQPPEIAHRDRLAADLIALYDPTPTSPPASKAQQLPNVTYPTAVLVHAPAHDAAEEFPTPLCPARSRRFATTPTDSPVNCRRCLQLLANAKSDTGILSDEEGQCPACGAHVLLTIDKLISHHQSATARKDWCPGAGELSAIPRATHRDIGADDAD